MHSHKTDVSTGAALSAEAKLLKLANPNSADPIVSLHRCWWFDFSETKRECTVLFTNNDG